MAALFTAAVAIAPAQVSSSSSGGGFIPVWELKKQLAALVEQTKRLAPLLEEVKPKEWPPEAPATYREQHAAVTKEIQYLGQTSAALVKDPEKMSVALEAFLRLNDLERKLDSLSEGVRRYQNPALADLIQGMISENGIHRNRLQSYLVELVASKQDELRIVSDEAQSCRASQLRLPPPAPAARPTRAAAPPPVPKASPPVPPAAPTSTASPPPADRKH